VFKIQINNLQSQIKDKKNTKRNEAQANLNFFLEATRGFYTKLLQDIVFTYKIDLPFCHRPTYLSSSYFDNQLDYHSNEKTKDKQLMYICQHILTHLGDISRYSSMFDQAKCYYLHAIRLVSYLGQPYNQIGILFETSRINQLSTVFYYIRSIAVKYTFPLAATNLENFLNKLTEFPLTRYPESGKLTHKDYIQLFLQINALIYTSAQLSKIQSFLNIFKQTAVSNSLSFEKLDSSYLCQMMSVLFFMLNRTQDNVDLYQITFSLLVCLIEQCVIVASSSSSSVSSNFNENSFMLPGFYLAFSYIEYLYSIKKIPNEFCINWSNILQILNSFEIHSSLLSEATSIYTIRNDYPLEEERNLDSFMPLKDILCKLNFRKYTNKNGLNEMDELLLRKLRLIGIFQRLTKTSGFKEFVCITNNKGFIEFKIQNVVASCDNFKKPVRRQNVALASLEAHKNPASSSLMSQPIRQPYQLTKPEILSQVQQTQMKPRWSQASNIPIQQQPSLMSQNNMNRMTMSRQPLMNNPQQNYIPPNQFQQSRVPSVTHQQASATFPTFLPDSLPNFNTQTQTSQFMTYHNQSSNQTFPSFFEKQSSDSKISNEANSNTIFDTTSLINNNNIWSSATGSYEQANRSSLQFLQIPTPTQFPSASELNENFQINLNFK
jgi:hypothetical protein